jgi:hypothetical protein
MRGSLTYRFSGAQVKGKEGHGKELVIGNW